MDDERDDVLTEEEVAEEASPETSEEAEEQQEDDYQGLVRRFDELDRMVSQILDGIARVESGMGVFVESGAVVSEAPEAVEAAVEEVLEDFVDIDELDLDL